MRKHREKIDKQIQWGLNGISYLWKKGEIQRGGGFKCHVTIVIQIKVMNLTEYIQFEKKNTPLVVANFFFVTRYLCSLSFALCQFSKKKKKLKEIWKEHYFYQFGNEKTAYFGILASNVANSKNTYNKYQSCYIEVPIHISIRRQTIVQIAMDIFCEYEYNDICFIGSPNLKSFFRQLRIFYLQLLNWYMWGGS